MNAVLLRQHVLLNAETPGFVKYVPIVQQLSNDDIAAAVQANPYTVTSIGEAFEQRQYDRLNNLVLSLVLRAADGAKVDYDIYELAR